MAGREGSGFAVSSSDLFDGARVWIVADDSAEERCEAVRHLWASLGARPQRIDAVAHDALMALVSHLPQLAATALAEVLRGAGIPPEQLGTGGLDMTRLAASSEMMWTDILQHAGPELVSSLRELAESLEEIARHVESGEVETIRELLIRTKSWRTVG